MKSPLIKMIQTKKGLTVDNLKNEVFSQWEKGKHFDEISVDELPNIDDYNNIPWEKIDCMLTKLIEQRDDGVIYGLDMFPPKSATKAELHIHPLSDRVITVLKGNGNALVKAADGKIENKAVKPGDVIIFPRNTPHCFWGSDEEPMVVQAILSPFVPFGHPLHTVCPKKAQKLMITHPELLDDCDINDLDELSKVVDKLVNSGNISLGVQKQMEWGDAIVRESLKVAVEEHDWACQI